MGGEERPAVYSDGGDEDGLGYYPDGVKRTLTDQQIAIFRHSEIQGLLRERRRKQQHEQEQEQEEERFDSARAKVADDLSRNAKDDQRGDRTDASTDGEIVDDDNEEYLQFLKREQREMTLKKDNRERARRVQMDAEVTTMTTTLDYDDMHSPIAYDDNEAHAPSESHFDEGRPSRFTSSTAQGSEEKRNGVAGVEDQEWQPKRRRLLVYSSDHEGEPVDSSPVAASTKKKNDKREFLWPRIGGGNAKPLNEGMVAVRHP